MTLFGSREEDPLLQNDPLAPSSGESGEKEPGETGSFEDDTRSEDARSNESSRGEEKPGGKEPPGSESDGAGDDAGSVFRSYSNHFALDGEGDTRVLVRSEEEALEGRLTLINAALNQGWRLARVEVNDEETSEQSSSTRDGRKDATGRSVVFVLRTADPQ